MEIIEMVVVIVDATGSVSFEHITAANQYACSILNAGRIDLDHEVITCVHWTGTVKVGHRVHLERLTEAFRNFDANCTIHFITDGLVTEEEIKGIDHIHMHEEFISMLPEYVKSVMTSVVPKHYMMEADNA
jgi:hypothetical protein